MKHPAHTNDQVRRAVESIRQLQPTCGWRHPRTGCICSLHARPESGRCAKHEGKS